MEKLNQNSIFSFFPATFFFLAEKRGNAGFSKGCDQEAREDFHSTLNDKIFNKLCLRKYDNTETDKLKSAGMR